MVQKKWQILDYSVASGKVQMDLDSELLSKRISSDIPNTLRFYSWKPTCITYGFFQNLNEEVDDSLRKKYSFDVVKRITGGGCVLHDNELTYSVVISETDVPNDILDSYKLICSILVKALRNLGIDAVHKPINDIVVGGKKISGNAQTRRGGVMLMHGTLLLDIDSKKFKVLKKVKLDKLTSIKELNSLLDKNITKEDLIREISLEFSNTFNFDLDN